MTVLVLLNAIVSLLKQDTFQITVLNITSARIQSITALLKEDFTQTELLMPRKTIGQIALDYMRSKDYQFVMCGDAHILHEIADVAGISHRSWQTERQIINAIDRSGLFVKLFINVMGRRRVFYLPEFAPERNHDEAK